MELTLITKSRLLVIHINGEIDHHAAGEIRRCLERELKRTGAINIAFDFGNVTFMDSAGIGMILGRYKTVQALGGQIIIYDMSESVRRLLEMSGLDHMAIMSDTLQHGINEMKKRRGVQV